MRFYWKVPDILLSQELQSRNIPWVKVPFEVIVFCISTAEPKLHKDLTIGLDDVSKVRWLIAFYVIMPLLLKFLGCYIPIFVAMKQPETTPCVHWILKNAGL